MDSGKDIMMMDDPEMGKVYILSLVTRLRVTLTSEKKLMTTGGCLWSLVVSGTRWRAAISTGWLHLSPLKHHLRSKIHWLQLKSKIHNTKYKGYNYKSTF